MKGLKYLLFQGVLLYETLAWEVRMPSEIHGLKGSCLVIPCSYSYTLYPPTNPRRVVWYQYVSSGYPLVCDPLNPGKVIDKFRGKTDIYRHRTSDRDCTLLIKSVDLSHNGEKLYAWIDPENVGNSAYKFYDVTSTITVDTNPQQPIINIYGGAKTGDSITVVCYTLHTCPYSKPNIILKGIEGSDVIDDVDIKNGQWKTTRTRTGVVKAERSDIECTVTYHGGVYYNITIEPKLAADIIEGVDMNLTCTVHHSCQNNPPILSWNYENMPVKNGKKQLAGFEFATFSTITFLGAKKDDGKKLICTTNISGQKITASVDLHVQRIPYSINIEPKQADVTEGVAKDFTCTVHHSCQTPPIISWNYENMPVKRGIKQPKGFESVTIIFLGAKKDNGKKLICIAKFSGQDITASVDLHVKHYEAKPDIKKTEVLYRADVAPKITALTRSCVVIPCTFMMKGELAAQLRVLWVSKKGYMYHTGPSNILDNFRGRTRLLGNPDEQNCTVEIDDVQDHDNGPFCFQAQKDEDKYKFNDSCVFILMRAQPDNPVMSSLPENIEPGTRVTVKCSVKHTCPSHPPGITWSIPTARETVSHRSMSGGVWETVSTVTFIPTGYEEIDEIVCTAKFWGDKAEMVNASTKLSVKRIQGVGMEIYELCVIAPVVVLFLLCAAVIIFKKRRR
ncbi:sialoadhesin-like [Misgurnus anguillicaudatus]|uniref:sialoadhesin-like n=1 Tax=Misgurnus anguillicaudatus TaxID=75329 RepID=UPI003CCF98C7